MKETATDVSYRQLKLWLEIEALGRIERVIAREALCRDRRRLDKILAARDCLVEEVQKWQERVERVR